MAEEEAVPRQGLSRLKLCVFEQKPAWRDIQPQV